MSLKPLLFILLAIVISVHLPDCLAETNQSATQDKNSSVPSIPFPAHTRFAPGVVQPNHISQQQQDGHIRSLYDVWKKNYLIPVKVSTSPSVLYRVSAGKTKRKKSYSEGQGYGMLLAVLMAGYDPHAQSIFDGLWLYSRKHQSRCNKRFMAYQVPVSRSRSNSAFDGDCDMALSLVMADFQWGSTGHVNYSKEGRLLVESLLAKVVGKKSLLPMLGDWVKQNGKKFNQYTIRSSDIMPAHFKVFSHTSEDRKWLDVTRQVQSLVEAMQTKYSPQSGLLPDFIIGYSKTKYKPAYPRYLESAYDGHYYYNAARVPWRIGLDALLYQDPLSNLQLKRIADWVVRKSKNNPSNIRAGYELNGRGLKNGDYLSKAFIAPFGVAAMIDSNNQEFVNKVFDLCVTLPQDYFEDTVGLLCLLLITGNFWLPS